MDAVKTQIEEIVNRETRAWDTQDADPLMTVFHPDMVWPWPATAEAHDPMDWVLEQGRYDAKRWRDGWQSLFDTHRLAHNKRHQEDSSLAGRRRRFRAAGYRHPVDRW